MSLDIQPVLIFADGSPVSSLNPLPTTGGGGGGGTVDQGKAGSAPQSWYVRDGSGLLATAAKQDAGNASLVSILGQLDSKTSTLATEATASASKTLLGAGLPAALVGGKLDINLGTSSITLPVSGPLTDAQLRATPVPVSGTVTVTSTTANQGTGAGAAAPWSVQLSDGAASYTGAKTGQLPTTLGQTTAAGSLSVVLNSNQVGTAGSSASTVLSVQGIASGTNLPVSQATASALNATVVGSGSAGTAAAGVVTVQGIASMTPVQVSQATAANLNATVAQGAGSGSAATFWYTRVTDGTNTMPTMDTVARSGYQRITDGTNTAAVKAASTAAVATDPALVATEKGCSWYNTVVNATALVRAGVTVLRCIIVNQGTASSLTLYDNGSGTATGTNFGITTGGAGGGLPFFIDCGKMTFVNGLTIVTAGTSPANVTLVYEP